MSGIRKTINEFWCNQTLERVHYKMRSIKSRSHNTPIGLITNRLPSALLSFSLIQRKTTTVWITVLFFTL